LIETLQGQANRRAHYYCVMVYVRYPDDPQPIIAEGAWHGEIIDTPRGDGGFGYDPYFFVPQFGKTGAELDQDEKNAVSHRGQALRALAEVQGDNQFLEDFAPMVLQATQALFPGHETIWDCCDPAGAGLLALSYHYHYGYEPLEARWFRLEADGAVHYLTPADIAATTSGNAR